MSIFGNEFRYHFLLGALAAVIVTIPLHNLYNTPALIVFVVACAFQQTPRTFFDRLKQSKLWILPVGYLIWLSSSYFWDVSGGYAARDIERYAILLFIPPFMAAIPPLQYKHIRSACFLFAAVTTAVCIICLWRSFHEYQSTHDYRVFYYHYLSMQMELNAIFLSSYSLASISWLLYFVFIRNEFGGWQRLMAGLVSLFLFAMILMLSSKMMLFLTLVVFMLFFLYFGFLKGKFIRYALIAVIALAAGFFTIGKMGYLNWRIQSTTVKKYSGPEDDNNGAAIRLLMWQSAWELIRERPLLGYGVRGAKQEIVEKYRVKHFGMGYTQRYHSHNQFLESALMGGLPALLLFTGMIIAVFRRGARQKNLLLLLASIVFLCQSLIAATFETQQELVFFIFFIFLFAYHPPLAQPEHYESNALL